MLTNIPLHCSLLIACKSQKANLKELRLYISNPGGCLFLLDIQKELSCTEQLQKGTILILSWNNEDHDLSLSQGEA